MGRGQHCAHGGQPVEVGGPGANHKHVMVLVVESEEEADHESHRSSKLTQDVHLPSIQPHTIEKIKSSPLLLYVQISPTLNKYQHPKLYCNTSLPKHASVDVSGFAISHDDKTKTLTDFQKQFVVFGVLLVIEHYYWCAEKKNFIGENCVSRD